MDLLGRTHKSATARSSIFLSPSAVRIVVPFRKHLLPWLLLFWSWLLLFWPWLVCPVDGLARLIHEGADFGVAEVA